MQAAGGHAAAEETMRLVRLLAENPRAAGSAPEEVARGICAAYLTDAGYRVVEEQFTYSAFPGKVATPLAGVLLTCFFVVCPLAAAGSNEAVSRGSLPVLLLLLLAIALLSGRRGILHLGWMRNSGINLVAKAGGVEPRVWLMAHLDSKSQPVSILLRAAGIVVCVAVVILLIVLLALDGAGREVVSHVWYGAMGVGAAGALPMALSVVGNRSRGALDNASGVAAVLVAGRLLAGERVNRVGIVITSAEELGLAGAHAWSVSKPPAVALNCDSVDDVGDFVLLTGGGRRTSGGAGAAVREALRSRETPLREYRMLAGILVDSMALEARGWDAVTLSKGSLSSLARIHRAADTADVMSGAGAAMAAGILHDAAIQLAMEP